MGSPARPGKQSVDSPPSPKISHSSLCVHRTRTIPVLQCGKTRHVLASLSRGCHFSLVMVPGEKRDDFLRCSPYSLFCRTTTQECRAHCLPFAVKLRCTHNRQGSERAGGRNCIHAFMLRSFTRLIRSGERERDARHTRGKSESRSRKRMHRHADSIHPFASLLSLIGSDAFSNEGRREEADSGVAALFLRGERFEAYNF